MGSAAAAWRFRVSASGAPGNMVRLLQYGYEADGSGRKMTSGGGAKLLRRHEGSERATFLELFLDLIYVFALTRLSQRLVEDFTTLRQIVLPEVGQTTLLLLALWLVWVHAAWVTSRYDPQQPMIQLVIVMIMFGSMIMAVALPHAFGTRGLVFALTYVAIQVGRPLALLLALRGQPRWRIPARILCWAALSAVPWIAGAALFPQSPARGLLWTLAVALDYTGFALGRPVPGLGRTRISVSTTIAGEHLAERYQQFLIIALGESILITGQTFANEFTPDRVLPIAVSFATTVLIWRIYFHRAGTVLPAAIKAAPRPAHLGQSEFYTHLVMVAGIVATSVGHALVIDHPLGHLDPTWLAIIFGGPALFLAGRSQLEYQVFGRVSRPRVIALLALAALAPAMVPLPPLIAISTAAVVLAAVAVRDTMRVWKRPPEAPSPPR
jgi:low temperature requirement protein LtrA